MPEAATLERPTNSQEAWRYADPGYLRDAELSTLTEWQELTVAAGEEREDTRIVTAGVERLRVHLGKGARYAIFALNAAGPYARLELEVTLEDGAHFEFGGVTVGGGDATQEFVTRTIHARPNGTSNQTVRAVQWGRSSGNFLGRIDVVKDAQKTDAAQNFRALLLEKGATANTKPELEIFADDVQCAHGAAIGQMDEMARYYMAARGIAPDVARKLLVQAFIGDVFVEMRNQDEAERMIALALDELEGNL